MRASAILLAIFTFGTTLAGQVSFDVFADARQVVINGFFEVTFTLKNADGANFKPPAFNDFIIAGGPNRSIRTEIVNGKVSKELTYGYTLRPKRTGTFSIGSATIEVNGKPFSTKPLTIEVIAGNQQQKSGSQEVLILAETSKNRSYIGQQIVLDYKLYTTVDIDNYNILEESEYRGFYAEDLGRFDGRVFREIKGGVQYATKILKKVALFPQQAGKLTIDPINVQLGVVMEDPQQRNSFFFNKQLQRVVVQSEPIELEVMPLPPNPPASFTGAVGHFDFEVGINSQKISTDDVLTLRLRISGSGDLKRVKPPKVIFPEHFEVYDPKILEENIEEINEEINGVKLIEYIALPQQPGLYDIKAEFAYFDPVTEKYITTPVRTFPVEVIQGTRAPRTISGDSSSVPAISRDIQPLHEVGYLQKRKPALVRSRLFWILLGIPLLLLAGAATYKVFSIKRSKVDKGALRSRQAKKMAELRLSQAKKYLDANNSRAFFDEVSKAMLGYVCDRLKIPLSALSKENVQEQLTLLKVAPERIQQFMKILESCELALFAGKADSDNMKEIYVSSIESLKEIESHS